MDAAEQSESFASIGDKLGGHSHGGTQAVDFSHASTIVADKATNGEKAMEQNQKEIQDVRLSEPLNSEHEGDSLHEMSEASSIQMAGSAANTGEEAAKDTTDERRVDLKDVSSENTSEAVESEKHDSVAASAGSSPPPSSAAADELHMDTDAKEDSEEGNNKEPGDLMKDSSKDEAEDDSKDDADVEKMDTEDGDQVEKKKEDLDSTGKAEDTVADAPCIKEEGSTKRVLPKWMVQDADAPPSPKEETEEKDAAAATSATENAPAGGARGRGRGRRGRDTPRMVAKPYNETTTEQSQPESLSSGRPRRSTRSNVDYAHPDVATVVAEQEDMENEIQQKVSRNRGRGRGRGRGGRISGRKRAAGDSDDGEDSGSEYGSHKKQKRTGSYGARARGRGRGRGRTVRGAGKKGRKEESDDDDEEMDLTDNDAAESPGSGGDGDEGSYKPTPSKRRAVAEAESPKMVPKKRGRAAAAKAD